MMILDVIINHTEKLRNLDFVTYILISNVWFKHVCIFFSVPKIWEYLNSLLCDPAFSCIRTGKSPFLCMWRNYGHARAINRGLTLRNETNMAVSRRDFVWTKTKK